MRRKNHEYEFTITQQWETKWTRITQENDELRRRLNELTEVNRKVAEYENRIALLSQEMERVNGNLRIKTEEVMNWENRNREWESRNREWESKWARLTQDNEELRRRLETPFHQPEHL